MRKELKLALFGCGGVTVLAGVAVVAVIWLANRAFESASDPVEDIAQYREIVAQWDTNLVAHFPTEATIGGRFRHQPGFMQGGASLTLVLKVDEEKFVDAQSEAKRLAIAQFPLHGPPPIDGEAAGTPSPAFLSVEVFGKQEAQSATVYVFLAKALGDGGFPWNHGRTCGVVVEPASRTVAYWAEEW